MFTLGPLTFLNCFCALLLHIANAVLLWLFLGLHNRLMWSLTPHILSESTVDSHPEHSLLILFHPLSNLFINFSNLHSYCHAALSFLNLFHQFMCPQIIKIGSSLFVGPFHKLSSVLNSACLFMAGTLSYLNAQFHSCSHCMLYLIHSKQKVQIKNTLLQTSPYSPTQHFETNCLFLHTFI